MLADGGFASHEGIDAVTQLGVRPLVVVPEIEKNTRVRKPSEAVARWRTDLESAGRAASARLSRATTARNRTVTRSRDA